MSAQTRTPKTLRDQILDSHEYRRKQEERIAKIKEDIGRQFSLYRGGRLKKDVALERACDAMRTVTLHEDVSWLARATLVERAYTYMRIGMAIRELFDQRYRNGFESKFDKLWRWNWQ